VLQGYCSVLQRVGVSPHGECVIPCDVKRDVTWRGLVGT